jgi:hypothetical protein
MMTTKSIDHLRSTERRIGTTARIAGTGRPTDYGFDNHRGDAAE